MFRPFFPSGKNGCSWFNIHVFPDTHRRASEMAAARGISLNQFVGESIGGNLRKARVIREGELPNF
ncbi:MAG: toxin-antitoxin system HicB family antitoxin [Thermodesulfobacteriota bacterium]